MSNVMNKTYIQEKLMGQPGQVVAFKKISTSPVKYDAIVKDLPINESKSIILKVTAPDNLSRIVVTNKIHTYESDPNYLKYVPSGSSSLVTSNDNEFYTLNDRVHTFYLPSMGEWIVVANKGGLSTSKVINIETTGTYEIELSYFNAYIDVTYNPGATCTCTYGTTTLTDPNNHGYYRFTVNSPGDWVIQSVDTSVPGQAVTTVHVSTAEEIITVNLDYINSTLNDNSWAVIQAITSQGLASSYWSIGDCKAIILNGSIVNGSTTLRTFNNETFYVELIGFDHNTELESNSKPTLTFQLGKKNVSVTNGVIDSTSGVKVGIYSASGFGMQTSITNSGGWENSYARNSLMPQFKNLISADLRSCLLKVTKYTDNGTSSHSGAAVVTATSDDFFLLSAYEITGSETNINTSEDDQQARYGYYTAFPSDAGRIRYRDDSTDNAQAWWTRSAYALDTDSYCMINTSGNCVSSMASTSNAISPAFVIGR